MNERADAPGPRHQHAIQEYDQAIELDPEDPEGEFANEARQLVTDLDCPEAG